jgi:DeoR family fructose operon transcriptional repressor
MLAYLVKIRHNGHARVPPRPYLSRRRCCKRLWGHMPKTLIPAQRHRMIREYLEVHQIVRSSMLSEMLGASEATIRRDLEWLERQGVVERAYGGAILSHRMPLEPAYSNSALAHPEEKRWIGRAAASLVKDGNTVLLNSGTTAAEVLHALRARTDLSNLTLVTNNLTAASEARETPFETILLGGAFRPRAMSTVGRFAIDQLRQFCGGIAIIGVDGISLKFGCTTPSNVEAEIGQTMVDRTRGPVIIVADHSKWGVVSNFEIAPLDRVHTLVVDRGLSPDSRDELKARSVNVLLAGPEANTNGLEPAVP